MPGGLARGTRLQGEKWSRVAAREAAAPGSRKPRRARRAVWTGVLAPEGEEGLVPTDGARCRETSGPVLLSHEEEPGREHH
eukprot:3271085-Lingulodinium_polyedra.AAC.1